MSDGPRSAAEPELACSGLGVRIGANALLEDVSLSVSPGSWLSVAGPNGAGKTTLLRALAGLVAHRGTVTVRGTPVGALAPAARARLVALVPQHPVAPPGMTVLRYVLLGRTAHLRPLRSETVHDLEVTARVLDELDLAPFAGRMLTSLSGGERQRAVIGRALAQEAPVLLLDEPTTGLDLGYQQDVLDLLAHLQARRALTICSTMHDLTLAGAYADTMALLAGGRLVALGPPEETLTTENLALITRARVRLVREGSTTVVVPLPRRVPGS